MIRIHTSPTPVEIHNLKNVLEAQGIACEVRGEFRRAAIGELPPNECWVELWIVNDSDEDDARDIFEQPTTGSSASWRCPECGEIMEGQFQQCWQCQSDRRVARETA